MKISVEKSPFLKALAHIQGVVAKKAASQILMNVLIRSEDGFMTMTASGPDLCLVEKIAAKIAQDGEITVSAQTLYEVVRKLSDAETVELSEDAAAARLLVKNGKSKFQLPTLPAKDFSTIKTANLPHAFVLQAEELRRLIESTSFCMCLDENRYALNGIYFHGKDLGSEKLLRAVATDGHRLALASMAQPKEAEGMPDVIIPRKTIVELTRLLADLEGEVEVSLSLTQIKFDFGRVTLISRLVDGSFPDYEKVIPKQNDSLLTVPSKEFSIVADRVSILADEGSKGVKMSLQPDKVILSASSTDHGTAQEELEAHYNGKRIAIAFNVKYLLNVSQQFGDSRLFFNLLDENSPVTIKGADDSVLYVLMPMRL